MKKRIKRYKPSYKGDRFIPYFKYQWNRCETGVIMECGGMIEYRMKQKDISYRRHLRNRINICHFILWVKHGWSWNWMKKER